ncbi:CobW family GTP-binding protein [Acinetobacter rudis]|uniref:CobW family GTP-binding protein n=1 Tax=Acinetobacter rudis TaxID=632955 RepID=UPI0033415F67
MKIIKAVKTHIISGFLGAGKTTLLQHLLKQKPENERWAVLMNEFGQIGVDQRLLPSQEGYVVKELLGGCLCCTSQLPMQLALSRLIQEQQPDRLFIEPTGLGHPYQLLEQLSEPHWHGHIDLRALVILVDGSRLHDASWTAQNLYQEQLQAAQIVVISHCDLMQDSDKQALQSLKEHYLGRVDHWILAEQGRLALAQLDIGLRPMQRQLKPLIHLQKPIAQGEESVEIKALPYHYIQHNDQYQIAGWRLPKHWCFDFYLLLDTLTDLDGWLRIKAIFNTNQGWKSFNFNPAQFNYQTQPENLDNRIEIISQTTLDWGHIEALLLACQTKQD